MAAVSLSSRNMLYQMCSSIRSAWNDPGIDIIDVDAGGNQCAFVDANGRDMIYSYKAATQELLVSNDDGANWYVMVENVQPVDVGEPVFSDFPPEDTDFPAGTVGKIIIRFKVQQGDFSEFITAAAVPRNVIYY